MSQAEQRLEHLHGCLSQAFAPEHLEIEDQSERHAGHAGAKGGGHYRVEIVADAFAGKSALQRHRMVYAAVGDAMGSAVHALSIRAQTPNEI